jgi:hypothetical protein
MRFTNFGWRPTKGDDTMASNERMRGSWLIEEWQSMRDYVDGRGETSENRCEKAWETLNDLALSM